METGGEKRHFLTRGGDESSRVLVPSLAKLQGRLELKYSHPGCDMALCASIWLRHVDAIYVGGVLKVSQIQLNYLLPPGW